MMDIDEFTERLHRIATVKKYRISSKDREAARIALAIIRELKKSQPLIAERFANKITTDMPGTAAREQAMMSCQF